MGGGNGGGSDGGGNGGGSDGGGINDGETQCIADASANQAVDIARDCAGANFADVRTT